MLDFFDREQAYREVKVAVEQIKDGLPTVVWIEGESGVGKTRFMEYVCTQENGLNVFKYENDELFFKCERGSVGNSFGFVSAIICELQSKSPKKFETYVQKYFDNLSHITLLDACCSIIPQLDIFKSISKLVEDKYKNITSLQSTVSDYLIQRQLITLFSDMIIDFISEIYDKKRITFCIDDVQWIDTLSLNVLESILKTNRYKEKIEAISIFVTVCAKDELKDLALQTYIDTHQKLTVIYGDRVIGIWLTNFDITVTREIIKKTNRYGLIDCITDIQEKTAGNPLELVLTLQFSDDRVKEIIKSKQQGNTYLHNDEIFTIERIRDIYNKGKGYTVILNVLSILRQRLSITTVFKCVSNVYLSIWDDIYSFSDFTDSITYLENEKYIERDIFDSEIALSHDSMWRNVLDYLSENGEYVIYAKSVANTLLSMDNIIPSKQRVQRLLALKLLCRAAPYDCFVQFKKIYNKDKERIETEILSIGTVAFCSDTANLTHENVHFMVNDILLKLVASANLKNALRLCRFLQYKVKELLPDGEQIIFLINYVKVQTDLSNLRDSDDSAINLFENLYSYPINNYDLKLQILLLGMSVYEHVLKHDKIIELYDIANEIVTYHRSSISRKTLVVFYRNKGLCFPHKDLKDDYYRAVFHAMHIPQITYRQLFFGTSMNNLGLAYFYNGDINKALKAFLLSKKHLESMGYNVARINSNIGACYYMLHDLSKSYDFFSSASMQQTDGFFMRFCIQTNMALALYSINKKNDAKNILDTLISEYDIGKPRSTDTLVYCAAMINRGYIAFKENDYFKSAENYSKSRVHTYRYQNEEQLKKRKEMMSLSLAYATGESHKPSSYIDLNDTEMDIHKKPYSLVLFAFYVI